MKNLIEDNQTLVSAKTKFGSLIPVYDDGFGPLFIHRDSMGISGIVRAQTWEKAYSICQDEFFPEADLTLDDMIREYSFVYMSGRELWLREHGDNFEAWLNLPEFDKQKAYRAFAQIPFPSADFGFINHPCWQESYGFRPSGANKADKLGHGIYAKDLNGDSLDILTPDFLDRSKIILIINEEE